MKRTRLFQQTAGCSTATEDIVVSDYSESSKEAKITTESKLSYKNLLRNREYKYYVA